MNIGNKLYLICVTVDEFVLRLAVVAVILYPILMTSTLIAEYRRLPRRLLKFRP